jgi:hypothetical protein
MAYTLASLITNIQRRVDSATTNDADVVAAKCGQVMDEIVAAFAPQLPSFLRFTDTFATVAGTRAYTSADLISSTDLDASIGLLRILPPAGSDVLGLGYLPRVSQEQILNVWPTTASTGTPEVFAMVGNEGWWLGPTPSAVLTYTVLGYKRMTVPEDSEDTLPTELPQDVVRAVEQGVVAYFKDERGDVDADIALKLYGAQLEQIVSRYRPEEFRNTLIHHMPDQMPVLGWRERGFNWRGL